MDKNKNVNKTGNIYYDDYVIYKPNKKGSGSACSLKFSWNKKDDEYLLFIVLANQNGVKQSPGGNHSFDWDNALTCKLGVPDIGEFLSVFSRRKSSAGYKGSIFHKSRSGTKIIKLSKADKGGYFLSVSAQDPDKKNLGNVSVKINEEEAMILGTLLKEALVKIVGWN